MKNTGKILLIVGLIACLGNTGLAYSQTTLDLTEEEGQMIQEKREEMKRMQKRMAEELGLSVDQQEKLEANRVNNRKINKEQRDAMKALHEQLKTEVEKVDIDMAKVYKIHQQIKALDNQIADARLEGMLEVRQILTPEQFKKFQEKAGKRRGKRGSPDKMHGGRHKGDRGEPSFDE